MSAALPAIQTATLATLCAEARDLLVAQWPDLAIRMGIAYVEEDTGGDRVVFLPNADPSPANGPLEIGGDSIASISQTLTVLVWAADDTDDYGFAQYDRAERLRNDVIVSMRALIRYAEHVELVGVSLDQTPGTVFYGEQARCSFVYKYDVDATNTLSAAPDAAFTKDTEVEREDP